MTKKTMKKIACNVLAFASMFACAGTMTACETSNPEVKIILTFDGHDYELEYKLYRKVTPTTVNHFLYLVENDYYKDLCIHNYDYQNSKMYTGGYTVSAESDTGVEYKKYYETVKGFKNFADFPVSVWLDRDQTQKSYTLYGEFEKNNFRVESGALKQSFGSLTMYYHAKDTDAYSYSEYLSADKEGVATREYKYNSATSLFYISLATEETSNSNYCTFATLKNSEKLEALQTAISEYITTIYGDEATEADFVEIQTMTVDEDDPVVTGGKSFATFKVPNSSIVIKDIKILKW